MNDAAPFDSLTAEQIASILVTTAGSAHEAFTRWMLHGPRDFRLYDDVIIVLNRLQARERKPSIYL